MSSAEAASSTCSSQPLRTTGVEALIRPVELEHGRRSVRAAGPGGLSDVSRHPAKPAQRGWAASTGPGRRSQRPRPGRKTWACAICGGELRSASQPGRKFRCASPSAGPRRPCVRASSRPDWLEFPLLRAPSGSSSHGRSMTRRRSVVVLPSLCSAIHPTRGRTGDHTPVSGQVNARQRSVTCWKRARGRDTASEVRVEARGAHAPCCRHQLVTHAVPFLARRPSFTCSRASPGRPLACWVAPIVGDIRHCLQLSAVATSAATPTAWRSVPHPPVAGTGNARAPAGGNEKLSFVSVAAGYQQPFRASRAPASVFVQVTVEPAVTSCSQGATRRCQLDRGADYVHARLERCDPAAPARATAGLLVFSAGAGVVSPGGERERVLRHDNLVTRQLGRTCPAAEAGQSRASRAPRSRRRLTSPSSSSQPVSETAQYSTFPMRQNTMW